MSSAEGARIEAPKALRKVGCGEGCPLDFLMSKWRILVYTNLKYLF